MSADKFAGRARRLAVTAIAASETRLYTGVQHRPPSDHPDIVAAERDGWIRRTSQRFGGFRGNHSRVTVFEATDAGRAALLRYGAPAKPTIRALSPSPKRARKDAEKRAIADRHRSIVVAATIARVVADPNTPAATRARLSAIAARRVAR